MSIGRGVRNIVIGLLFIGVAAAAPPKAAEPERRVSEFVLAEMQREKVPGVAVGVFSKGEVLLAKGYGDANVEHHAPVTEHTVFESASVGKQFTAVAVMLQVEAGKLALDDSITKFFTEAPQTWGPITVRQLLTHTSGLQDYFDGTWNGGTDEFDTRSDHTEEEMMTGFYRLPLEAEPGTRWHYSNTGYVLLGFLVRRVSGQFYGDILKKQVFGPLGMTTARVISEEDIVPNRAAGYRLVNGELRNQEWYAPTVNTTADGSLYLSVADFAAWDRGLRAGAILKPQSWAEILAPVHLKSGSTYPYGFGWFIDESNGGPWYHHSGSSQGFTTFISRYRAHDLTIVVLTNLIDADPSRFVDGIAAIVDREVAKLRPTTAIVDTDPKVAERLKALLATIATGPVPPRELRYTNRTFTGSVNGYAQRLRPLGLPQRLELLDRRKLGDDLDSTFAVHYGTTTLRVQMTLAPDGRVSDLDIDSE